MSHDSDQGKSGLWKGHVRRFESLDSTNTWARENIDLLHEGDVVVADLQTAGRGRFERPWLGLPGKSLMMSLILRDPAWIPLATNLGQAAALALVNTAGQFHVDAKVKWPNDVMVNDRKVAGILVERGETGDGFVLGIGLNVNVTAHEFDQAALDRPATSMAEVAGHVFDMDAVRTVLLRELERYLGDARAHGMQALFVEWRQNDWLRGRSIRLLGAEGGWTPGEYLGISSDGALRLKTLEGYERLYWSGEVERVTVS